MASNKAWKQIFKVNSIAKHDFSKAPFVLNSEQIKAATQKFKKTADKEVRLLCKQDSKADKPDIFIKDDLFLLPKKMGNIIF